MDFHIVCLALFCWTNGEIGKTMQRQYGRAVISNRKIKQNLFLFLTKDERWCKRCCVYVTILDVNWSEQRCGGMEGDWVWSLRRGMYCGFWTILNLCDALAPCSKLSRREKYQAIQLLFWDQKKTDYLYRYLNNPFLLLLAFFSLRKSWSGYRKLVISTMIIISTPLRSII
jgi:hypothetical protein